MSDLENLIEAIERGELDRVLAVLESDDRLVNQRDEIGAMPLHYATLHGHRQIVKVLLQLGAETCRSDPATVPIVSQKGTEKVQNEIGKFSRCDQYEFLVMLYDTGGAECCELKDFGAN